MTWRRFQSRLHRPCQWQSTVKSAGYRQGYAGCAGESEFHCSKLFSWAEPFTGKTYRHVLMREICLEEPVSVTHWQANRVF